ncbi:MAG TPA: hypothetical protein VGO75_14020 [Gemmatimonadaceae bacterium]|nr:hypothetical protein [Gemmatimonadaceae bacterium]
MPSASKGGEITWAIIPAVMLAFLLVATWQRIEARETHMMMDHSGMQMPGMTPTPSQR